MSFGSGGGSSSIAGSSDVTLSSPATDDFLGYDSTTSKWQNKGLSGKAALVNNGGLESVSTNYSASGNVTLDLANGNVFRLTLSGDVTLSFTGATNNRVCAFTLHVKQANAGDFTVTWPSAVIWPGGNAPTVTSTPSAYDVYVFETITGDGSDGGAGTWMGFIAGQDLK
jgi:hypothetical protein